MIDITPLDVRNKRGDFKKLLRGYDPQEVDTFLELVAERLEVIVRENLRYQERSDTLERQVTSQSGREAAVQEALVTAQELRVDIRDQAKREADHVLREAEAEVRRLLRGAERKLELGRDALEDMERRRTRFLKAFRQLLERELDVVEVEEERAPLEDRPIDLDLGGGRFSRPVEATAADESGRDESEDDDRTDLPPLDTPIDELAEGHERTDAWGASQMEDTDQADARSEDDASEGSDPEEAGDETLSLSFEDDGADKDR
jgi:DivIVA domain-containing protein